MNQPGVSNDDLLVRARSALLDALGALEEHRDAVIVIGAQAIYLHTGGAPVALAETTKDSDLALDPTRLDDDPRIEQAMTRAGFYPDPVKNQPGAWLNPDGVPVDLMVAEALAGPGSKSTRGARIPPHGKRAARRARGLEAAVVDNSVVQISALDPADPRTYGVRVAGPTALLVAKAHKIAERVAAPDRLNDKDAHDIYRILVAIETDVLVATACDLVAHSLCADTTSEAIAYIRDLFAAGPNALASMMAGRAEEGIGEPDTVALAVSILAGDFITALGRRRGTPTSS